MADPELNEFCLVHHSQIDAVHRSDTHTGSQVVGIDQT
jgi:hypothetical protein